MHPTSRTIPSRSAFDASLIVRVSGRSAPQADGVAVRFRIPEPLRAAFSPMALLPAGLLLLGWLALVGWTGAGPAGWQSRVCAGLDLPPRSCGTVRPADEAARPLGEALS
ncbi:hypothetical protein [Methylobacterium oxalidis]|uniref:Uncharacterized protein n=1 Tax=Methylobacterium oxalidis TaxID=944322 RepID=A0A512J229_9HYPH|nr:hypothetical protein [Methylobacterium oxalidis]GEP03919.1 hypothetical protein MOX02_19570 [Methylobacterium oxalidis]GJE31205.1 hypothetical protein LDDCCGHA_1381 [Methylobacterium oxalidis]GLS65222.1 hypothetical protein GCM10007888_36040 [Methylobacterium oxalidis]